MTSTKAEGPVTVYLSIEQEPASGVERDALATLRTNLAAHPFWYEVAPLLNQVQTVLGPDYLVYPAGHSGYGTGAYIGIHRKGENKRLAIIADLNTSRFYDWNEPRYRLLIHRDRLNELSIRYLGDDLAIMFIPYEVPRLDSPARLDQLSPGELTQWGEKIKADPTGYFFKSALLPPPSELPAQL